MISTEVGQPKYERKGDLKLTGGEIKLKGKLSTVYFASIEILYSIAASVAGMRLQRGDVIVSFHVVSSVVEIKTQKKILFCSTWKYIH